MSLSLDKKFEFLLEASVPSMLHAIHVLKNRKKKKKKMLHAINQHIEIFDRKKISP
jgi:hypothetical protein